MYVREKAKNTLNSRFLYVFGFTVIYQILYSTGRLDYETDTYYDLVIEAYDYLDTLPPMGYPGPKVTELHLLINLTDINDNTPQLDFPDDTMYLLETQNLNEIVYQVSAYDIDSELNGELLYEIFQIIPDNNITYFIIDEDTGFIQLNYSLDLDLVDFPIETIVLTVTVTDKGTPSLSNSTSLTFVIEQVDEYTPVFTHGDIYVDVVENQLLTFILFIANATDLDYGLGGEFVFEKRGELGNPSLFNLDASTGVVTSTISFDRETKDDYSLRIAVETIPTNPVVRSSTIDVYITILDENDNYPVFQQSIYVIHITENHAVDSDVTQITATDLDINLNANLQYELFHENSPVVFLIDMLTGAITLTLDLNLENPAVALPTNETFNLTITAFDRSSNPLYTDTTLLVVVTGVNEFSPQFANSPNQIFPEDTPLLTILFNVSATDLDYGLQGVILYSILSGNGEDRFDISATKGVITLINALDRENIDSYTLVIRALDNDVDISGRREDTITIGIGIEDVNDNIPIIQQSSCYYLIPEDTQLGTNLFQITATDEDISINADIEYLIEVNVEFSIDSINGNMSLSSPLDFEVVTHYILRINARDMGSPSLTSETLNCSIEVTGVNEHSPIFLQNEYTFSFPENSPINTEIGYVEATDEDAGIDGEIVYSIIGGDNRISIDNQGRISVFGFFDREHDFSPILLNISAVDAPGGIIRYTTYTSVIVAISDVNDNYPVYSVSYQYVSISEDTLVGVSIAQYLATDEDEGDNSLIRYAIETGDFEIDTQSGVVSVLNPLDRETYFSYSLVVSAVDQSVTDMKTSVATLFVSIEDINDNPPIFTQSSYNVTLEEDIPVSSIVLTLVALDVDFGVNGVVVYSVVSQSADYFEVEVSTGALTLTRTLVGSDNTYVITVRAIDLGSPPLSSTAVITVRVTPSNRYTPEFLSPDNYTVYVEENTVYSAPILTVTATDLDQGDLGTVEYSIVGIYYFLHIEPTNGSITLQNALDSELYREAIVLQVQANDLAVAQYRRYAYANVILIVLDSNDNSPYFPFLQYLFYIPSDFNDVIPISAIDIDTGVNSDITYSLSGDICYFYTDILNGGVSSNGQILQVNQVYRLVLTATDHGTPVLSNYTDIIIEVVQNNFYSPIFLSPPVQLNVAEDLPLNEDIHKFEVIDFDIGDSAIVEFYISNGNTGHTFSITNEGTLYLNNSLDFEDINIYTLTVIANNPDTRYRVKFSSITVVIIVTDINDVVPEFASTSYIFTFATNFISGDSVGTVDIIDDVTHSSPYSITGDSSIFTISRYGVVSLTQDYDSSIQLPNSIEIQYNDGLYTVTNSVNLMVEEPNLHSPIFPYPSYSFTVLENTLLPIDASQIVATDLDIGMNGDVSYLISQNDYLSIEDTNGLSLVIVQPFDYEQLQMLTVVITAEDNASPWQRKSTTIEVKILISDQNDSPCIFTQTTYTFTVENNTVVGGIIGRVTATDEDVSYTLIYQFLISNDYFDIDKDTGDISVARELTLQNPTLIVSVNDSTNLYMTNVIIAVIPANLHTPVFSQQSYYKSIPEDTTIGTVILQIMATDLDTGVNGYIVYTISYNPYCIINSTTGVIELYQPLDAETQPTEITVHIIATDIADSPFSKYSSVYFILHIENINDNSPVFPQSVYPLFVEEGTARGVTVYRVVATDEDRDILSYTILSGNLNDDFTIEPDTGLLYTNTVPYVNVNPLYNLRIQASDGDSSVIASFEIQVIPSNQYAPEFTQEVYYFEVSYGVEIGDFIGRISAMDLDTGDEGILSYSIIYQTRDIFVLNHITGVIQLYKSADTSNYTITAQVCDNAVLAYKLCTNTTVHVNILQRDNQYLIQPVIHSRTLDLPGYSLNLSFNAFQITLNSSDISLHDISLETLTCITNLTFSIGLDYPYVEVILTQTGTIQYPIQTHLRVGINNSIFSTTILNLLPQHDLTIPTFTADTYYIRVSLDHTVASLVAEVTLDSLTFGRTEYELASGNEDDVFSIQSDTGRVYLYSQLANTRPLYIISLLARSYYTTDSPVFVVSTATLYVIVQEIISENIQPSSPLLNFNPAISYPNNIWSRNGSVELNDDVFNLDILRLTNAPNQIHISLGDSTVSINSQIYSEDYYSYLPNNQISYNTPVFQLIIYKIDGPLTGEDLILNIFSQSYTSPIINTVVTFTITIPALQFDTFSNNPIDIPFTINSYTGVVTLNLYNKPISSHPNLYIQLHSTTLYSTEKLVLHLYAKNFDLPLTTFEIIFDISDGLDFVSFTSASGWSVFSQADTGSVLLYGVNDVILNSSFNTMDSSELIGHLLLEQSEGVTPAFATLTTDIKLVTDTVGVISDGIDYADFVFINGIESSDFVFTRIVTMSLKPDSTKSLISSINQKDILEISNIIRGEFSTLALGITAIAISFSGRVTHVDTSQLHCSVDSERFSFIDSSCDKLYVGSDNIAEKLEITITYDSTTDTQYVDVWAIQQISVLTESDTLHPISSWLNSNCEQQYQWTKLTIQSSIVNMNSETRQIEVTKQLVSHLAYNQEIFSIQSFDPSFYLQLRNPVLEHTSFIIALDVQVDSISMVPQWLAISSDYFYITGISSLLVSDISSSIESKGNSSDILSLQVSSTLSLTNRVGFLQNSIILDNVTSIDYILGIDYLHVIPVDTTKLSVVRGDVPQVASSLHFASVYTDLLFILSNIGTCGGNVLYSTNSKVEIVQSIPSSVQIEIEHTTLSHTTSLTGLPTASTLHLFGVFSQETQDYIELEAITIIHNSIEINSANSHIILRISDPDKLINLNLEESSLSVNVTYVDSTVTLEVYIDSMLSDTVTLSIAYTATLRVSAVSVYTGEFLEFLPKIGDVTFEPFTVEGILIPEHGPGIHVALESYQIMSESNSPLCVSSNTCTLSTADVTSYFTISGSYKTLSATADIDTNMAPTIQHLNIQFFDYNGLHSNSVLYGEMGSYFYFSLHFKFIGLQGIYSLNSHNLSYFTESLTITSNDNTVTTSTNSIQLQGECDYVEISIQFFTNISTHNFVCNYLPTAGSPHLGNLIGTPLSQPSSLVYTVPLYFHFEDNAFVGSDILINFNSDTITFSHITRSEGFSLDNPTPYGDVFILSSLTSSSLHIGLLSNSATQRGFVKLADLSFILQSTQTIPNITIHSHSLYKLTNSLHTDTTDLIGDINQDNTIDLQDVLIMSHSLSQQHISGADTVVNDVQDVNMDGMVDFEDFRRLFSSHFGILPLISYETNSKNACSLAISITLSHTHHSIYTEFNTNTTKVYVGLFSKSEIPDSSNWELTGGTFVSQFFNGEISVAVFEATPGTDQSIYTLSTDLPILSTTRVFAYLHSTHSLPPISGIFSLQDSSSDSEPISTRDITLLTSDDDPLPLPFSLHPLHTITGDCSSVPPTLSPLLTALLYGGTPSLVFIILVIVIILIILLIAYCVNSKKKKDTSLDLHVTDNLEKEALSNLIDSEPPQYRGLTYYPDPSEANALAHSPSPFKNSTGENPVGVSPGHFLSNPDDSASGELIDGNLNISHKVSSTHGPHHLTHESLPGTPKKD